MFLIEGLPAIGLGVVVFRTLADRPQDADWLSTNEKEWLLEQLATEQRAEAAVSPGDFWKVLVSARIWLLSVVYFGVSTTMYGLTIWLPSVIHYSSGLNYFWTSLINMLPFLATVIVMVLVGMRSDRVGERRWHTAIPAFTAAAGLVFAAYNESSTAMVVAGTSIGMAFAEGMVGPFWALATSRMSGLSAAAGIAVVNSLANLGGYFGPDLIGRFRTANGGFRGGLLAIAATVAVSGSVALIVGRERPVPVSPSR
jgi:ACS family tartrate transporter-like MFS transporter